MLNINFDEANNIAILEPDAELSEKDFTSAARIIDQYLEKSGSLNGVIIHVKTFPGWDSFSALVTHLKFIKEYHKRVSNLAVVTDSSIGFFAERVGSHFINAKVKKFDFNEFDKSVKWITSDNKLNRT
ncbi:MAG: STAS/SEC14 domain-containing protein [Gammaproteobacteria bacterium]|nr:STAS/SEC14 domain-containing protein [Gammaproteobacteria bacterium]